MVAADNVFSDHENEVKAGRKLASPSEDEAVVLSGIGGTYPDAGNVTEFAEKLFGKVDMISDDDRRWALEHPEIPHRTGKINVVTKFDASFFGMHYNQAHSMDPMCRILLEKTYEAVIDSGINPYELKGSRTGVFIGACYSESEKTWFYEKLQANGFAVTGCVRSMMANRISYYFGFDGPSCTVDTACSSSMYAFEYAYRSIREGLCDAAIVGGCNLCLHPYVSLQFARIGVLSMDGRCKPFDKAANGYCRSEAVCVVYLRKKKDARRIYATVVHAKTNCDGYKEQGITYPSGEIQQQLFTDFYQECGVDPSSLNFVEAHGTGTRVGDPEEIKALVNTFCGGRNTPLKIGSVKSNIGHAEPASGLCSITKVVIAMETGMIPPNINLHNIRDDIEAFNKGIIQVVTEPTPWEGGLAGINSFGFGGANCHILLKWNEKSKINGGLPTDDIPRLVNTSGRTVEGVEKILDHLESRPIDAEFCKLFHDIHKANLQAHNYRGFVVLQKNKTPSAMKQLRGVQDVPMKKPLYFYFPGIYSELKKLDNTILQLPVFSGVMSKLSQVLAMDVFNVVSTTNNNELNLINNFIELTAVQIALVDLLKTLDIVPDKIIGSSIGEIACAYADRCINAEEAILTSYYIAAALKELKFQPHLTVKIGLPLSDVKNMASSDIEISPINKKTSIAVGPKSIMINLINNLRKRKVEVIEMRTCEMPIHSRFAKNAATKMISYLKEIIRNEKIISSKWLTSIVTDKCSGEYFCRNILEPLHSDQLVKTLTDDANILEIGPNGVHLLSNFAQLKTFETDNVSSCSSFLLSLGRLYLEGVDMNLSNLYPEVKYPVSRSTPMISPLLSWDHSEDWYVTVYKSGKVKSGEKIVSITLNDEETEFISGHVIDGRNLYPATGYLALVWDAVASNMTKHYTEVPIIFENVKFHRATTLAKDGSIDFTVLVQKASGNFEVVEGGAAIVTGKIIVPNDITPEMSHFPVDKKVQTYPMNSKDFYKELRLRGYNYKGLFRSVVKANVDECVGKITWHKNWVAFMDNMLQMQIIMSDTRGLFVPTSIDRVLIDPKDHSLYVDSFGENAEIPVVVYKDVEMIKSGGIEIYGLKANSIARRKNLGEAVLEKYQFVPNETQEKEYNMDQVVRIMVQTVLENESTINVKVTEIPSTKSILSPTIAQVLGDLPLIQPEITVLTNVNNPLVADISQEIVVEDKKLVTDQSMMIVVASNILNEKSKPVLDSCLYAIKDGGFLIVREPIGSKLQVDYLQKVQSYIVEDEEIMLFKKVKGVMDSTNDKIVIEVTRDNLDWLAPAQEAMRNSAYNRVYFVSQNDKLSGILGLVNCLRKEPGGIKARCVFTFDADVPKFSLTNPFYITQLSKDIGINVFKNGKWGTYRHLLVEAAEEIQCEYMYANNMVKGDVSSITWLQGNEADLRARTKGDQLVNIYYSSLNFRDIMLSTGKLSAEVIASGRIEQECVVGFEFSGLLGDKRIMGLTNVRGLASKIIITENFHWEVPEGWTLEEAATVPCVYLTVIYGLLLCGKLKPGESILIHAGSGGVGQAALNIALSYGCTVFTTVGTPEKKNFLLQNFPQLSAKNIGNSRDTTFEQMVLRETNGRGVDMVLNSLAEEKLIASVRCLAQGGRFIEIGKFDISNNNTLGMEFYKRGATFAGVMLDNHFNDRETMGLQERIACEMLKNEINRGSVKPLVRTVFEKNELEQAFRYMAAGKHIGKVLIKVNDSDENLPMVKPPLYKCKPRFFADMKASYIITGGLGGFGLELADWLVLRGVRNLVLVSRRGITNGYQDLRINIWKTYGTTVVVSTADITKKEGVETLLKEAEKLGPIKGIFNLAVVLRDGIFNNQTIEAFKDSIGPKADSTIYLDTYSRKMCPQLEQFVVFSSVSCGRGNGGQTNYGWSNSVMERVCEQRKQDGFPATAVQWGAVGDAGLVAEMQDEHIEVVIGGTLQQRINSCLDVMNVFLTQSSPIVSSMVVAEKRAGGSSADNIVDTVANILGLRDLKNVSLHSSLAELGMDSMMAVEIKQTLEREFEVFLSPQDIRGLTFAKLCDLSNKSVEEPVTDSSEVKMDKLPAFNFNYLINIIGEHENVETLKLVRKSPNSSPNNQIFVAPGIEGQAAILEPLSKLIESNVHLVQFNNTECETVEGISVYMLPQLLNLLPPGSNFNLVGYSWGGLPILDLAYKLEKLGYSGKICLIDSSPDLMRAIHARWAAGTEDEQQISILSRVVDILCPQDKLKVEVLLKKASGWAPRLKILSDWSDAFVSNFNFPFRQSIINGIYCRVKSIEKLKDVPDKGISSPVYLIRPAEIMLPGSANDYGLSKYTKNPVTVQYIEGDHLTVLNQKATADAINAFMGFKEIDNHQKVHLLHSATNINIIKENVKNI